MASETPSVLIVDDERVVCDLLSEELVDRGYQCTTVLSGNEALAILAVQDFDVLLLDIRLPGISGMEVLKKIWLNCPNISTIMITAVNEVDTAVEAMKLGASDYLVKPLDLDRVDTSIRTTLETKQVTSKSSVRMDAIARGVEARFDLLLGISKIIIQETIDIARRLDILEQEIQSWMAARARLVSERDRAIKSSLEKLKRSPLAQKIMGIAVPYLYTPKPDEPQN